MDPRMLPGDRLGNEVRDRRHELGLTVRALAGRAGISPAYVTSIETGRNSSTGRPPLLSMHVVTRLAAALEVDVQRLIAAAAPGAPLPRSAGHVLLYLFGAAPATVLDTVEQLWGADVDHWLYIADPRHDGPASTPRATVCRWDLGAYPYETPQLDPAKLIAALEEQVRRLAVTHRGQRVGIAITDCSAVMRYVQNAAAEVGLERIWHQEVHRIWTALLGTPPAMDVCAYRHDDISALGLTIDQLATALDLVNHHESVLVVERPNDVTSGPAAIRRILQSACPPGVSPASWSRLADAAAETLASRP